MLLDHIEEQSLIEIVPASRGQRFANYCVDLLMTYILGAAIGILIAFVLLYTGNEDKVDAWSNSNSNRLEDYLFGFITTILYYTFFEFTTGGKTVGKYVTKTRAITSDGQKMDFATVLARSCCRVVPFDAFSFLGDDASGWHDKWSKTLVIKE